MQWLRDRIHFGWVAGAALAMTVAYFATGTPTLVVSNAANEDVPTIPTVTQPPRPTIPPRPVTTTPDVDVDEPTPPNVDGVLDDAAEQAEEARQDAEEQRADAEKDAEEQRQDAEEQADEARRDAEQQRRDAERQREQARASHGR
jgi:hypothetical protein